MSKLNQILIGAGLLTVLVAVVFLMTAPIPAPSAPVEKTLSNDRFPS